MASSGHGERGAGRQHPPQAADPGRRGAASRASRQPPPAIRPLSNVDEVRLPVSKEIMALVLGHRLHWRSKALVIALAVSCLQWMVDLALQ